MYHYVYFSAYRNIALILEYWNPKNCFQSKKFKKMSEAFRWIKHIFDQFPVSTHPTKQVFFTDAGQIDKTRIGFQIRNCNQTIFDEKSFSELLDTLDIEKKFQITLCVKKLCFSSEKITNNMGELLAIFYACIFVKNKQIGNATILSDSQLVVFFWLNRTKKTTPLIATIVSKILAIKKKFNCEIQFTDSDNNEADLGKHRKNQKQKIRFQKHNKIIF